MGLGILGNVITVAMALYLWLQGMRFIRRVNGKDNDNNWTGWASVFSTVLTIAMLPFVWILVEFLE
jgi:hypothetical protein